jgi:hypothetical protein
MNNFYIMQAPPSGGGKPGSKPPATAESNDWGFGLQSVLILVIVIGLGLLTKLAWPFLRRALNEAEEGYEAGRKDDPAAPTKKPKVSSAEPTPPARARGSLTLDDVNDPPPRPGSAQKPAAPVTFTPTPATTPAKPTVIESTQPPPAAAPGDFEKALAQAGQRMDALLRQTEELTRSFKLAEKAKMDAQVELNKATTELTRQLGLKDDQIAKLDAQLDRKSTFPSLRALIEVKKLCLDMLNTQKEIPREQLVNFVTAEIDSQLANLEVQLVEFPVGTPLEKIPGDQVETDRRQELTDDQTKNNQVARLLRPCYFLERDTKRIVVAKALVILYRYNAPSSAPAATPSTPTA